MGHHNEQIRTLHIVRNVFVIVIKGPYDI